LINDENEKKKDKWMEDENEMIKDKNEEKNDEWEYEMDGEWEEKIINNKICESDKGCGNWKNKKIKKKK
jgi:hypothetical protein